METTVCDLCKSDRANVVLSQRDLLLSVSDEEFSIVRCLDCGLMYLNPRPAPDEIGDYYPAVYYPPVAKKNGAAAPKAVRGVKRWLLEDFYGYPGVQLPGWKRSIRRLVLWPEKIRREFRGRHAFPWRGQGRVLDVGCGVGGNLKTLQEQGWEVYGIEISEKAANHARALVGDTIHTGTLETARFAAGTFDLVLMNHSLEHLFSPTDALRKVSSLLSDQGLLVVTVPNAGSLEAALFKSWWFHWDPPRHLYHFDKERLVALLSYVGFSVEQIRTGVGTTFFIASLERFLTHRWGRKVRVPRLLDRFVARPLCLAAGHAGYGTEITVYAVKA